MDKIYPDKPQVATHLILTEEETLALKKALVLAIEKKIEHLQDRALDAVRNAKLTPERVFEIKAQLYTVIDLEPVVRTEGAALASKVEADYRDGDDALTIAGRMQTSLVDKILYAKRFLDVKLDRPMTPIFEEVPAEPLGEGEEIIKP